jgi:uncharacterized membrane protein
LKAREARYELQLRRLENLTDCVFAVALVLVLTWLPLPEESTHQGGPLWLRDLFAEFSGNLVGVLIGLVFVVLYWRRNNQLLGYLQRTDEHHTTLGILQVAFLLLLLYSVRVSGGLQGASSRATESVATLLVGVAGTLGWWYGSRRSNLLREGVDRETVNGIQVESLSEPLAALITLPLAYVGPLAWNLAWLSYIPISRLLKHRLDRGRNFRATA